MKPNEALEKAVASLNGPDGRGGMAKLAKAAGIPTSRLSMIVIRSRERPDKPIPASVCPSIERITGVKSDWLNPDVDWAFLRGTSPTKRPAPKKTVRAKRAAV